MTSPLPSRLSGAAPSSAPLSFKISRAWATPLTLGSFVLMAVTGVLMFFHLDQGLNKLAHEWLGWLMVAGVALHAVANGLAFKRHLTHSRTGQGIVAVSLLVLAASFFSLPGSKKEAPPPVMALRAMLAAPVAQVAPVAGLSPEQALARLKAVGVSLENAEQSVASVTRGDRGLEGQAVRALFGRAATGTAGS